MFVPLAQRRLRRRAVSHSSSVVGLARQAGEWAQRALKMAMRQLNLGDMDPELRTIIYVLAAIHVSALVSRLLPLNVCCKSDT